MPRPICVSCACEMVCKENDYAVRDAEVGDFPSTCWLGDRFSCPQCNHQIVVGFGRGMTSDGNEQLELKKPMKHVHQGPGRDCAWCGNDLTHDSHKRANEI